MLTGKNAKTGFTIVELLIVIVVIGILATITIVSFNGIQSRARDSQRASDISTILKSLELYRINNPSGAYPTATGVSGGGGWEFSTDPAGTFMEYLEISKTPTDPTNNATYKYWYYRYPPGYAGCDATKGGYYILRVVFENASNKPTGQSLNCSGYVATDGGTLYTMAKFENER